jgi:hypothetical protein
MKLNRPMKSPGFQEQLELQAKTIYRVCVMRVNLNDNLHSPWEATSPSISQTSSYCMEPDGQLPCSQKPTTCTHPEADQSSPRPRNVKLLTARYGTWRCSPRGTEREAAHGAVRNVKLLTARYGTWSCSRRGTEREAARRAVRNVKLLIIQCSPLHC